MDLVKDALKWLAINFGSKHPYISTLCAMVLAGFCWIVFYKSVSASAAKNSVIQTKITQKATQPTCGNIVQTGGDLDCKVEEEKPSDPHKTTNATPSKTPH